MTAPAENAAFTELMSQIGKLIKGFDERRKLWRRRELVIWVSQGVFAALTTVLAGFQFAGSAVQLKNGTLVASALAAFLTVVATRVRARERWAAFTRASSALSGLESKLRMLNLLSPAARTERLSTASILALHGEMQAILDAVDNRWGELVSGPASAPEKGN